MKKIMVLLFAVLLVHVSKAQTGGEVTDQNNTQIKYMLKQIVLLQDYIGRARKAYKIAKDGLHFIGDMKNGEFNLHKDYFNSLKNVNPNISTYWKIADIITVQISIVKKCRQLKSSLQKSGMNTGSEMDYIGNVTTRLLDNCSAIIDQLTDVTTDGKLQMKDDERIKRIDVLQVQMQDNYSFIESFGNKAKLLSASRQHNKNDVQTSRLIHGIKN